MDILGIDSNVVLKSLADFHGTDRRFEYKGTIGGVTILDDYAHHPTEITATLKAAANYPHKTLQTEIEKLGKECYYFHSFDEIENFLLENCINGDLLITMGAGDVVKIGENLLGI